jgi:non-specific serine/threonine protein kinase
LLDPRERELHTRLSVFAGGFTLDAAEAVADADLETLASLLEKSLVHRQSEGGRPRFAVLETVREYAAELAGDAGEVDALAAKHARYFLEVAEAACANVHGAEQVAWLDRVLAEQANFQAALARLRLEPDGQLEARLVRALALLWLRTGQLATPRAVIEHALDRVSDGHSTALELELLLAAGASATSQLDFVAAKELAIRELELARAVAEPRKVARALGHLGIVAASEGEHVLARRRFEEALTIARKVRAPKLAAAALSNLAYLALMTGEYDRAATLCADALDAYGDGPYSAIFANALLHQALALLKLDRAADAAQPLEASLRSIDAEGVWAARLESRYRDCSNGSAQGDSGDSDSRRASAAARSCAARSAAFPSSARRRARTPRSSTPWSLACWWRRPAGSSRIAASLIRTLGGVTGRQRVELIDLFRV